MQIDVNMQLSHMLANDIARSGVAFFGTAPSETCNPFWMSTDTFLTCAETPMQSVTI